MSKRGFSTLGIIAVSLSWALPQAPVLISGSASFSGFETTELQIAAGDRTFIEWGSFSIQPNEKTQFIQPGSDSIVINKISGPHPSEIFGLLQSNGKVVLINPSGIVFGREASVDVNSLIASTLDLNADLFFEKGQLSFQGGSSGKILNEGTLAAKAGEILLFGREVEHTGSLSAKTTAGLFSCDSISYDRSSSTPFIFGISNETHPFQTVVSGSIDAPGGHIYLFGPWVAVHEQAKLDVSSSSQAGKILIGGDFRGEHGSFIPSLWTEVQEGASLLASGLNDGNGGTIVVWGDRLSKMAGSMLAQGGAFGGDGGTLEVSSLGLLDFTGQVSTLAPHGSPGMLWLDPLDLTITNAGANVTGATPFTPTACPGATLDAAVVMAALGGTPVTITTVGTPAAPGCNGDITVATNGAITWDSIHSLTIDAARNLTILAPIQNGPVVGTGAVQLIAGGTVVTINQVDTGQRVSAGSQHGLTSLNAPNAAVTLFAANTALGSAQLGFYTPNNGTASGPIQVNCAQLTLSAAGVPPPPLAIQGFSGAQIGHGQVDATAQTSTAVMGGSTPDINVTVSGNINLIAGFGRRNAWIGHGSNVLGVANNNQTGAVNVVAQNGNLLMNCVNAQNSSVRIGHGGNNTAMTLGTVAGDITVRVPNGAITMNSSAGVQGNVMIGHGCPQSGGVAATLSGDVYVSCRGNLMMFDNTANDVIIGHAAETVANLIGHIRTTVGGNLTMQVVGAASASFTQIGYAGNAALNTVINGDVTVVAGGNINLINGGGAVWIGDLRAAPNTSVVSVQVAAGQNIAINSQQRITGIFSSGNAAIGAGNDIIVTSGLVGPAASAGTINRMQPLGGAIARIYAYRDILSTNGPAARSQIGPADPFVAHGNNFLVDIRAGGDVQLSSNLSNTQTLPINVEADAVFAGSQIWGYTGSNLTSIAGVPLLAAYPITETNLLPAPISGPSPAQGADGRGAFRINTQPFDPDNNIVFQSTTGNIILHSADTRRIGGAQNLTIGPANPPGNTNQLRILTTSGNIEVTGSVPGDAFANIFWNGTTTTAGHILAIANIDQTLSNAAITSSGSFVTLVVDNKFPVRPLIGPGIFVMDATSQINAFTTIRIYTALQENGTSNNQIDPLASFNGVPISLAALPYPGTLFVDTIQEQWCTYYPEFIPGTPFTISYKNCLQIITQQAMTVIDQFLVDLHPYNEFPGWMERFLIEYRMPDGKGFASSLNLLPEEPYYLRRRHLNTINHPKTYTQLIIGK